MWVGCPHPAICASDSIRGVRAPHPQETRQFISGAVKGLTCLRRVGEILPLRSTQVQDDEHSEYHTTAALLVARWLSVIALKTIVSRQQAIIVRKTPFQPNLSAIQPTPAPDGAEPRK